MTRRTTTTTTQHRDPLFRPNAAVELLRQGAEPLAGLVTKVIPTSMPSGKEADDKYEYEVTIRVAEAELSPAREWRKFTGNEAELRSIIHGDRARAHLEIKVENGVLFVRDKAPGTFVPSLRSDLRAW